MSTTKQNPAPLSRKERRTLHRQYVNARLDEIERQDREEDIKRLQARAAQRCEKARKPK